MDSGADRVIEAVEALLNATSTAPSFGLNSRELILRAARQACEEPEEALLVRKNSESLVRTVLPDPKPTPAPALRSSDPAPVTGLLAERLVREGLTVYERPIVQYTPRSSVPRISRQVRDTLQGQLAFGIQQ